MRSVLWFAAASMLTTIVHEAVHACVAYTLGVPSTLFNDFVDLHPAPAEISIRQRTVIGAAGPLACLGLGVLAWAGFRRARGSTAELPLLYVTVFGTATFFGNLMSMASVGDFSSVARALSLPMWFRYAMSATGALAVAAIHFWGGRELARGRPTRAGSLSAAAGAVAMPAVLGTACVIVVNLPMPPASLMARLTEAGFWLFAAGGALATSMDSQHGPGRTALHWADGVALALAVLLVRLTARGIVFTP